MTELIECKRCDGNGYTGLICEEHCLAPNPSATDCLCRGKGMTLVDCPRCGGTGEEAKVNDPRPESEYGKVFRAWLENGRKSLSSDQLKILSGGCTGYEREHREED